MAESTTAPPSAPTVQQLSPCPSNYSISNLSECLLNEILCRLPCASAFQCKCVCKRWYSLISHPYFLRRFIHHHCGTSDHHHHPLPLTLVLQLSLLGGEYDPLVKIHRTTPAVSENTAFQLDSLSLKFPRDCLRIDVVASWKDLLICQDTDFRSHQPHTIYFIFNPFTRQWLELPQLPDYMGKGKALVGFLLDGCADTHEECCSFNVDGAPFEYKLVCFSPPIRFYEPCAWIFSSVIGEWINLRVPWPWGLFNSEFGPLSSLTYRGALNGKKNAVTFKRMLHWIFGETILVYDPNSNKQFRAILLPRTSSTIDDCVGVCQEHLCVTQLKREQNGCFLMVWKLLDNDYDNDIGTWCLEFEACLGEFVTVDSCKPLRSFTVKPELLALHPYDGGVVYLKHRNDIYACTLQTRTLKMVSVDTVDGRCYIMGSSIFPLVHPCWPTPVSSFRPNSISLAN